ncbi:MAG TPA: hypothetical protein VIH99_07050 [Bdellovibrionota bacterium]|jgi:hypothetical protein
MTTETATASLSTSKFTNRTIIAPLGPIARYHLRQIAMLVAVPLLCGTILLLLLSVFAKLNLYYLEANGLIVDEQVRDAYYSQVQSKTMSLTGFVLLQLVVTTIVSVIVMRWASAPFMNATRTMEMALSRPDQLQPTNRLLSESPYFDRVIWLFALRVKSGGQQQAGMPSNKLMASLFFLVKFWVSFGALSVVTGYFMGMIIGTVYERIIGLAIDLVRAKNLVTASHFFQAQQEVLRDATTITTLISLAVYFVIGIGISRYMSTMIFVFSRAVEEDRFPVQLRTDDVYHGLASTLNRARDKIR